MSNPKNRAGSKTNRADRAVSRRTLLRGTGVAMALPWLESIPVWGSEKLTDDQVTASPQRFAALFMGCGINRDHWWAKGSGTEMELGKSLAPMEPIKHKMNFITGLYNENANGVGIHPGQTGNILSGASLKKGSELRGDISMDQVLANHFAEETVAPSLVLGCEQPTTGYHETNFSMAYSSHISWQNATSPVPMEVYPSLAFDSLFDNHGSRRMESILDRVREETASLNRKISQSDRTKLDEYLSSVREVEKRAEAMRTVHAKATERAHHRGQPIAAMKRPDDGLPEDIREHMQLMCDIIAIGFQTDKSRVATLLLNRDLSGLFYPFLDVTKTHHSASHDDRSDEYERISRYYCSQYAYLASKLDAMPEGDGTVLDHSCLLFISSMWSGSSHDSTKLPVLLTGGMSGRMETGRVLDYLDKGDDNRKLCGMYLTIMDRMGVKLDRFGDAENQLAGL
ncbi:DUF1552 domain-containing protein [Rosistilla oblonga]|uniref:DUF1552 domain-containing protein n=1 Tax=Rosistilla oblonga TaxID=2527990 RepID=A0A518IMY2_9BACT|nr:DUF1552 domain-containing protein [Rosistilla oblonga]QDV54443.1 hypothetical protein Mal33_03970 [Rosistilla oblonga]